MRCTLHNFHKYVSHSCDTLSQRRKCVLLIMSRRGQGLGLVLLGAQLFNVGIDNIPPVTLATIVAQVAIFLRLGDLNRWFHSAGQVCISAYKVWDRKDWSTLVLGTLYHADDIHLYYNMVSFLWKGRKLEKKFGSVYFAYLLVVFTVLTSMVYVALGITLAVFFDDPTYKMTCAVGFSGVIFALKVLVTYYSPPGIQYALGFIPVPSRMIFWAELVLIQLITPNASFVGHLAGILVGLLYIRGPLKSLMDSFIPPAPSYQYTARPSGYSYQESRHNRYNYSGYSGTSVPPPRPAYTDYTGGLSEEEQLQRAREASLRQGNGNQLYPDLDELRQRRQNRYQ